MITSKEDGRIVLDSGRCPFPEVLFKKIWSCPDLSDRTEILSLKGCRGSNLGLDNTVCVNPDHYKRVAVFSNENTRVLCPNCKEKSTISTLKDHYTICVIQPSIKLLSDSTLALYETHDCNKDFDEALIFSKFIVKNSALLKKTNATTESTDEKDAKHQFLQRYIDYENNIDSEFQKVSFTVTLQLVVANTENDTVTVKSPPFDYSLKDVQTLPFETLKKNLIKPQFIIVINAEGKEQEQELIDPFDYFFCRIHSLFENQYAEYLQAGITIKYNNKIIHSNADLKEFFRGSRLALGASQNEGPYHIYVTANNVQN